MEYTVVYDIMTDRLDPEFWFGPFLGLVVSAVLTVVDWRHPRLPRFVPAVIGLAWLAAWGAIILGQHPLLSACKHRLRSGAVQVVEGRVQNLKPVP